MFPSHFTTMIMDKFNSQEKVILCRNSCSEAKCNIVIMIALLIPQDILSLSLFSFFSSHISVSLLSLSLSLSLFSLSLSLSLSLSFSLSLSLTLSYLKPLTFRKWYNLDVGKTLWSLDQILITSAWFLSCYFHQIKFYRNKIIEIWKF